MRARENTRIRTAGLVCAFLITCGACAPPDDGAIRFAQRPPRPETPASRIARLERIRALRLVAPKPAARPPRVAARRELVRGVYGRDSSDGGVDRIRAAGFNAVTVMPNRAALDDLARRGLKGLVWLWGYDRSTCSFAHPDDAIRREVTAIAGHPAILAYQIADEPNYARADGCPRVPAKIKARSDLVRSIDPSAPTYVVISTWDGVEGFPYRYFAGTTDIMGLDVYPYSREFSRPGLIDVAIREAERAGVRRYWAVLQDFSDGYYVVPTASQLREQFRRWKRSRMEGYFVYHWNAGAIEARADHVSVYAREASA